ncbi:MAG TPA: hypothetical protein IAB46_06405 [Candidatus Scybalocola faecigallinarum]|uniref:DUF4406 domain-containing protein n=1 Tax=Candidatus Scybalocola faecigallinarum TaxID=2840941 RepID=A0A9D1F4V7_9FIRM|nr:hypothetical protein [Candidatus Scybalocola faecigallinarum]
MKTVTICGSMKFADDMKKIAFDLECNYHANVLQCVYNVENKALSPKEKEILEQAHYEKIRISDAIYVVDIQGYIGSAVSEEIRFARDLGKEILLHSEFEKAEKI